MGQLVGPFKVASDENGATHLTITLELNINLNSDGTPASLGVRAKPAEDFTGMDVPEFTHSEPIKFGKKVT